MLTRRIVHGLVVAALLAPVAGAQGRTLPACTMRADTPRRVELPDGRIVSLDVQSIARNGDTTVVIGRHAYVFPAKATPQTMPVVRDSIIGVLIAPDGKTALVPAPIRSMEVLFPKVAPAANGFHFVFASARGVEQSPYLVDSATIWYARFHHGSWSAPERVMDVRRVKLSQESTSALLERSGVLSFAFTYHDSADDGVGGGGAVMLRRRRGTWTADTLRSERKPQGIRLAYGASSGVLSALTVLHDANSATEQSHLQLATFGEDWRDARVIATSNLGALSPSLAPLGDTFVASWSTWKPPGFESSTIAWVRVGRDGRVVRGRAVSHGENSFPFEMFVVDNAHPIWLYRTDPPGRAIVATATDTMPLSLGTITVPFDNFKVSSTPIDRARVLAFTTKVGKAPDEPMGALYATVLEFRCPGSAQR